MSAVLEERIANMADKLTEVHNAVTGDNGLMVRLVKAEQTLSLYGKLLTAAGTAIIGLGIEVASRFIGG